MTTYCFVASPGFSNRTFILGALPLGTASDGETYTLLSCEYPIRHAIPINPAMQPTNFSFIITLLSYSPSPIGAGNQMRIFFHLQNHRRKILLRSFVSLPRVNLESSPCGRHSRPNRRREI